MEIYHRTLMKLACIAAGDKELELFTLHKALLSLLGYDWWDPPGLTLGWFIKRVLYPVSYVTLLVGVSFLTLNECYYLDTSQSLEFFIFMNNIVCVFTFMYAAIKTIYMKLMYGRKAKQLFQLLAEIGEMKVSDYHWKRSLFVISLYFALLTSIVGFWTATFLIRTGRFPYESSYPWDHSSGFGWFAAFSTAFTTASYCSLIHSSIDTIISLCCGVIMSHLSTVKEELRTIGLPGNPDSECLNEAIELQVKLIEAATKMNYCFDWLFAFQSVYTVLHACVLLFTFVKAEDFVGALFTSIPMLSASYAQLFMYCYFGQLLTTSFEELTFATYDNAWYRAPLSVRKGLILFSRQSMKTISVRGLGSFKASFATYLSSFQESISYYLILKTVTSSTSEE